MPRRKFGAFAAPSTVFFLAHLVEGLTTTPSARAKDLRSFSLCAQPPSCGQEGQSLAPIGTFRFMGKNSSATAFCIPLTLLQPA
jgi:hypothetical protein